MLHWVPWWGWLAPILGCIWLFGVTGELPYDRWKNRLFYYLNYVAAIGFVVFSLFAIFRLIKWPGIFK